MIKKMIVKYLQYVSQKKGEKLVVNRHINSAIELMYQIKRHGLEIPKSNLPSLLDYDFTQKNTLAPEVVGFFFSYLNSCGEGQVKIKEVVGQIEPLLQAFLRRKKLRSLPTIYSILNVCAEVDFQHEYLYKHIENFIGDFLANNPKFYIPEKDIKFLNIKMIRRGYGSKNLKNFVEGVL